jgi:hypothetical protein
MKNAKLKIKNEGENRKWGNEASAMLAGCSAWSAGVPAQVQGLKFKADPVRNSECGARNIDDLRSKTISCCAWMASRRSRERGRRRGRSLKGFWLGYAVMCRLVPPPQGYGAARLDVLAWDGREKAPSRRTLPAQSTTIRSISNHWRYSVRHDFGLRREEVWGKLFTYSHSFPPFATWYRSFQNKSFSGVSADAPLWRDPWELLPRTGNCWSLRWSSLR